MKKILFVKLLTIVLCGAILFFPRSADVSVNGDDLKGFFINSYNKSIEA